MLKEIVYWVYMFFSHLRHSPKNGSGKLDSVMFVSICLFLNVLALLNIIEYYTSCQALEKLPITTKWSFSSWVCIILLMLPFIILIYMKYLSRDKLSVLIEEYELKSKRRLKLGSFFAFCYCIITWVVFFMTLD